MQRKIIRFVVSRELVLFPALPWVVWPSKSHSTPSAGWQDDLENLVWFHLSSKTSFSAPPGWQCPLLPSPRPVPTSGDVIQSMFSLGFHLYQIVKKGNPPLSSITLAHYLFSLSVDSGFGWGRNWIQHNTPWESSLLFRTSYLVLSNHCTGISFDVRATRCCCCYRVNPSLALPQDHSKDRTVIFKIFQLRPTVRNTLWFSCTTTYTQLT